MLLIAVPLFKHLLENVVVHFSLFKSSVMGVARIFDWESTIYDAVEIVQFYQLNAYSA